MKPLVIVGAGGHARVVAELVRAAGLFEIVAFVDELADQRDGDMFLGARVFTGADGLVRARQSAGYALPAFGDNAARLGCCERLHANDYEVVSAVHPRAWVAADVAFGAGTVIVAGAVVGAGARLGEACIVNTGATVDHDCFLGDGVHIEPGAHLGGSVRIGSATTIGLGALVGKGHSVGAHSHIGAGAVVVRDVPDGVTAWGTPARVVRESRRA